MIGKLLFGVVLAAATIVGASHVQATDVPRPDYVCTNEIFAEPWVAFLKGHGQRQSDFAALKESCAATPDENADGPVLINKLLISLSDDDHARFAKLLSGVAGENDRTLFDLVRCMRARNEGPNCNADVRATIEGLVAKDHAPAKVLQARMQLWFGECDATRVRDLLSNPLLPSYEFQLVMIEGLAFDECEKLEPAEWEALKVSGLLTSYTSGVVEGNRTEYFGAAGAAYWGFGTDNDPPASAVANVEEAAIRGDYGSNVILAQLRTTKRSDFHDPAKLEAVLCHPDNPLRTQWTPDSGLPFKCAE